MKLLIIGDIYGKEGISYIVRNLNKIKIENQIDLTIANAENASVGGKSLVREDYHTLMNAGIDYFTMGNHTFKNPSINEYIDEVFNIVRPANWLDSVKGRGYIIFEHKGKKFLLINLLGQAFIEVPTTNPYHVVDEILSQNEYDFAIVDFHAEATAEKIVLANYLKNRVNVFFGTHTHIQTSDERMLGNMAYITDVGMVGVFNSAIGANFAEVEEKQRNSGKIKFKEAEGKVRFNAIVVNIDLREQKVIGIKRLAIDDK